MESVIKLVLLLVLLLSILPFSPSPMGVYSGRVPATVELHPVTRTRPPPLKIFKDIIKISLLCQVVCGKENPQP